MWLRGEWQLLHEAAVSAGNERVANQAKRSRKQKKRERAELEAACEALMLEQEWSKAAGQYRRSKVLPADQSPESVAALREKHPAHAQDFMRSCS